MTTSDSPSWQAMTDLATNNPIVIDRPKGCTHPPYPFLVYPLDYGSLENTCAVDGAGIEVWSGPSNNKILTGILCTFDRLKRDAEIRLLIGCTLEDVRTIQRFNEAMRTLFTPNLMVEDGFSN